MKRVNLEKTVKLLKSLDNRIFSMEQYRNPGNESSQKCGSVGCIIGHATTLDTFENWSKYLIEFRKNKSHFTVNTEFDFTIWSYDFFGFDPANEQDMLTWDYIFHSYWGFNKLFETNEILNSTKHAMYRINKVLDGYLPGEINSEIKKEIEILEKELVES